MKILPYGCRDITNGGEDGGGHFIHCRIQFTLKGMGCQIMNYFQSEWTDSALLRSLREILDGRTSHNLPF